MGEGQNERVQSLIQSAFQYLKKNDFESAIEELKTAEILDKDNPVVLYNLGVIHSKQGLHKTAVRYYDKLLLLPFTFIDVINVKKLLAYSHILSESYDEALVIINETIRMLPNDLVTLSLIGYCYEKIGKIDSAISFYEKILSVKPDDTNAMNSLAYLLALQGQNLDKALALAKKALEKNPDSAAYNDTVGFIFSKKKHGDMAKKHLKKALEKDPASSEIRAHLNELLRL